MKIPLPLVWASRLQPCRDEKPERIAEQPVWLERGVICLHINFIAAEDKEAEDFKDFTFAQ